jgi:hypothetical protein
MDLLFCTRDLYTTISEQISCPVGPPVPTGAHAILLGSPVLDQLQSPSYLKAWTPYSTYDPSVSPAP